PSPCCCVGLPERVRSISDQGSGELNQPITCTPLPLATGGFARHGSAAAAPCPPGQPPRPAPPGPAPPDRRRPDPTSVRPAATAPPRPRPPTTAHRRPPPEQVARSAHHERSSAPAGPGDQSRRASCRERHGRE